MVRPKLKPLVELKTEMPGTSTIPENLSTIEQCAAQTSQDKLDKILEAIQNTHECLESKIDNVAVGLNLLRDDHKKLEHRLRKQYKKYNQFLKKLRLVLWSLQTG